MGPGRLDKSKAFDYYAQRSRRAAENFRKAIDGAVGRIAENGEAYPLFDGGVHRCLLEKYPFGVLYTLEGERAVVIVVMHTGRRPGYWQRRR